MSALVPASGYVIEAGHRINTQMLTCKCGFVEHLKKGGNKSSLPPEFALQQFRKRGWEITSKEATCPACVAKRRQRPLKEEIEMAPTVTPNTVVPINNTAREMQPADRRRVFRAIDDVWDDSRGRYIGENTDNTIAESLKLPRAWIEEIRRESFGSAADNDALEEFAEDLEKAIARVDEFAEQAMSLQDKFVEEGKFLRGVQQRLEKIRAAFGPKA